MKPEAMTALTDVLKDIDSSESSERVESSLYYLTSLASRLVRSRVALLSQIEGEDETFTRSYDGSDIPGDDVQLRAFCREVAAQRLPLIVGDTGKHHTLARNAAVTRASIGAYIGFPLFVAEKARGALCAFHPWTREWTLGDVEAMQDLAALATTELNLRSARAVLAARDNDFYDLLEHATDMIMRVGFEDGSILFANQTVRETLGYTQQELLGKEAMELVAPEFKQAYAEAGKRIAESGYIPEFSAELVTKGGERVVVQGSANCQYQDGKPVSARLIFKDITVKQRLGEEIALIEEVCTLVSDGEDLAKSLSVALGKICEYDGWDRGEVWLDRAHTTHYEYLSSWTREGIDVHNLPRAQAEGLTEAETLVAMAARGLRSNAAAAQARNTGKNGENGTILVFPLMFGEDLAGLLVFTALRKIPQIEQRAGVLSAVATQLGPVVRRRVTEEALRASEQRYRHLIDTAQEGVWTLSPEGISDYVNARMADIAGYTMEEMLNRPLRDFIHPESRFAAEEHLERSRRGSRESGEYRLLRKGDKDGWVLISTSPIVNPSGKFEGVLALVTEITKRKVAETRLRMREKQLSEAQKIARLGSWDLDLVTGSITASPELYSVLGLEHRTRLSYEDFLSHVIPADLDRVKLAFLESIERRIPLSVDYSIVNKDGETRNIFSRGDFYYNQSGVSAQMAGIAQDVTEHKATENELQRTAQIIELANDAVIIRSFNGQITYWSHGAEQTYGWTKDEALGQNVGELLKTSRFDGMDTAHRQMERTGRWAGELTQIRKDGKQLRVDGRWTLIRDTNDAVAVLEINSDITEQQRTQEVFGAVLAAATDYSIIGADSSGLIHTFNAGAERLLGYSASEIVGKKTPEMFHEKREIEQRARELGIAPSFDVFVANVRGGESETRDWTYVRKDGTKVPVSLTITEMRNAEGNNTGYIGIAVDITERRATERANRMATEAAEQAARMKSEFLANMSHEIRTPMNGITGMTELLLDTDLSREQREYLELVRVSADSLLRIIDDILDFSRIDAGKLHLEPHSFDLRPSLKDTLRTLELRAQEKGIRLHYQVHPEVPDRLVGDAGRLRQVVVNLVENAIKFTSEGEVGVDVSTASEDADSVTLRVLVSDTGIGIPSSRRASIFDPFIQADASTTRRYGGSGLGLSISKQLVEMMNGSIWVESEEGKGSRFFFTARLLRDTGVPKSSVARQTPKKKTSKSELPPLRILVAEDNPVNQRVAMAILEKHGHSVTAASTGTEALRLAQSEYYDAILMDVQMPELGGLEATQMIRVMEEKTGKHVPVIGVTAHALLGDAERCLESGMDAYCAKPIQSAELIATLDRLVPAERRKSATPPEGTARLDYQPNGSRSQALSKTLVDRHRKVLDTVGGDVDLLVELAELFLSDAPPTIENLVKAVNDSDFAGATRHAHKLRGSAAVFGAEAFIDSALAIERMARSSTFTGGAAAVDDLMHAYSELAELLTGIVESGKEVVH